MTNDLKHFGIPGMKWGIRRTAAQLGSNFKKSVRQKYESRRTKSEDYLRTKQLRKKKVSQLSNKELKELNNRLQLERQFKDLTKPKLSIGRKHVNNALSSIGKQLVSSAIKGFAEKMAADFAARYGPGGSGYSYKPDTVDLKFLKD